MIEIIGYYTTQFGELWDRSLFDLVNEAIEGVLKETGIDKERIEAVFFANMLAGVLENNLHSSSIIAEIFDSNIPIFRVEAACASGGVAFYLAEKYVRLGQAKTVLVLGGEKMTDYRPEEITSALMAAASGAEQSAGLSFPGLYGLMARVYLERYGYQEKDLAYVAIKNHYHATLNPKAHFRREIGLEDVLSSPYVAEPLKLLDSSPISDGAAALIITTDKSLAKRKVNRAKVLSCEMATDCVSLFKRREIDRIPATTVAMEKALKRSKVKRREINVLEVHDCFTIAEILAMEDLGFWKKGEGGARIRGLSTKLGNSNQLVVNPSGGLKAAGHPVGATGIKQIGEIYLHLTNQAKERQVKGVNLGLAHNVGGSGGTVVVTILSN